MGFNNSEEVSKYIGGHLRKRVRDPEIGPNSSIPDWLSPSIQRSEAVVVVDMPNRWSPWAAGPSHPRRMTMTADIGNAYCRARSTCRSRWRRERSRSTAKVASLLKLAPLGKKLYGSYIERLKRTVATT